MKDICLALWTVFKERDYVQVGLNMQNSHLSDIFGTFGEYPYFAVYNGHPRFVHIIHRIIIPINVPMGIIHPYFSLKILGKKSAHYTQ